MIWLANKRFHQNRSEHLNVFKSLSSCMESGTGMSSHFSKLVKLNDNLKDLGSTINQDMAIDFILMSLPVEYKEFINHYKQYVVGGTLSELRGSLMAIEMTMGQMNTLISKPRKRGKKRSVFKSDETCHYCGEIGHWKSTCPSYFAKKTKASEAGSSGMFVIEIFSLSSQSWVFDTGCGYHICNDLKELQEGQESFDDCESCLSGMLTKAPLTGIGQRAKDLLGLVHTDVCGPFRTMSRSGERYFVTFTDDFSRYGYVYLMKHKHETFEMFEQYQNEVQNQLGKRIKMVRSDRGGEYLSQEFDEHLKMWDHFSAHSIRNTTA
ncbi:hypothetical protein L1987_24333 [Smallanthus sonchifolius]|uniref:Uncharacterized protein n=1 Tax=Smallanthus sonchifolius TaxID=185202 RepID=A0ACB9ILH9_9ASTR|nr:hypothetical protein L1987_24333 [Smallanthus sonchifolius]